MDITITMQEMILAFQRVVNELCVKYPIMSLYLYKYVHTCNSITEVNE